MAGAPETTPVFAIQASDGTWLYESKSWSGIGFNFSFLWVRDLEAASLFYEDVARVTQANFPAGSTTIRRVMRRVWSADDA